MCNGKSKHNPLLLLLALFGLFYILMYGLVPALYPEARASGYSTNAMQRPATSSRFEQTKLTVYGDSVYVLVDEQTGIACYRDGGNVRATWACAPTKR